MILLTGGESMTRLFDLDWQLLADSCLTIIAVFVLFFALSYFLFNPARKVLDNRKKKIHDEIESAKQSKSSAESLKAQYEEKLKNIDKEAESILSDARKRALASENQIVEQAKEEASRIIERAKVEAGLERQKIADDVKKEMISVASVLAGKIVSASIDTSVQDKLIDETLKEMGDSTWLS